MLSAVQNSFNSGFNKFIDTLVNTSFSEYFKLRHIPDNYIHNVEEKALEEILSDVVAYDYKAVLFNALTCLAIAETVTAVAALALGFFAIATAVALFAAGSIVLRELISQNIHETVTGHLEEMKGHPVFFRKLIIKL